MFLSFHMMFSKIVYLAFKLKDTYLYFKKVQNFKEMSIEWNPEEQITTK